MIKPFHLALEVFCAVFTSYVIGSWFLNDRRSADIEIAIYVGIGVAVVVAVQGVWRAKKSAFSELENG